MRHLKTLLAAFFLFLCAFATSGQTERRLNPQGPTLSLASNVPFSNFSGGPSQSTIYLMAIQPQQAMTIFITNQGSTSHAITVNTSCTGNTKVNSRIDTVADADLWTALPAFVIQNGVLTPGAFLSSNVLVGIVGTTQVGTGIMNCAQVAIQFENAANSADLVSLSVTFTGNGTPGSNSSSGGISSNVQGTCGNNTLCTANPILIAGLDQSGADIQIPTVFNLGGSIFGLQIMALPETVQTMQGNASKRVDTLDLTNQAPLGVTQVGSSHLFANITTSTATTFPSRTNLLDVTINQAGTAWTILIAGATCPATTPTIATIIPTVPVTLHYDVFPPLTNGICITTTGATPGDITVVYQ